MRFPSVQFALSEARASLNRFPFALLAAFTAAVSGNFLFDNNDIDSVEMRLLMSATLGLPLFVAMKLFAERRRWGRPVQIAMGLIGLALLAGFFLQLPRWQDAVVQRRYFQCSLFLHLLVAVLPYMGTRELNGFWQYNRQLFVRFLTAVLYSAVLYVGLVVALVAVDKLLGVDVDEDLYWRLWMVIAFLFNTWFFLGGVPSEFRILDSSSEYPTGLKILSQFILVPIVTLYLVILTIYMAKVALTRVWPSGWIGYLVSSVSVVGILSLLLVHPIQHFKENRWVANYSRWFYIALIPSIVMLLLAIWKRINQYGLTENRYFMVVLSVWLAGIAVYFILSRSKNIKVIPATLCALALLTSFGPWGAYAMSERSQRGRLEELLTRNGLLFEGHIRPAEETVPVEDRREIGAAFNYLTGTHGTGSYEAWFGDQLAEIDTLSAKTTRGKRWQVSQRTRALMDYLNIEYVERLERGGQRHFQFWSNPGTEVVSISGYDYLVRLQNINTRTVDIDGESHTIRYDQDSRSLRIERQGERLISISLAPAIVAAKEQQPSRTAAGAQPIEILAETESVQVRLTVLSLNGYEDEEEITLNVLVGDLLLRFP